VRFLLVRVDDRMLHGQVVYGWGGALQPRGYLIADDRAAQDPWERGAYEAASAGAPVAVRDLERFGREWREVPDAEGTIVLLRDLDALHRLWRAGFRPEGEVNLGGLHAREGSRECLSFVHLTAADEARLIELLESGCDLCAQELPGSPRHGAAELRARVGRG
jgi:mannose/fructose/N-acetylgalactosamine-specific phosphotransferase system component IIB